jgi:hypothetical protein
MKSLWDFLDEDNEPEMVEKIEEKSNHLTRGAWQVVKQVLVRKNENMDRKDDQEESRHYGVIETEFGPVNAAAIVDKIELKRKSLLTPQPSTPVKTEALPSTSQQPINT